MPIEMLKTVLFIAIILCNSTSATICVKCVYMKSGSQLSGSRLCQDICEGKICYIVVSAYQNETLIAGCLDGNDYDVALFKDRNICQRRSQYTVCGCSKTKRCNSPMAYSKLFEFIDKPILEDYQLIPESNESFPHSEEFRLDNRAFLTPLATHEGEIYEDNEEKLSNNETIHLLVSSATSTAMKDDDEQDMGVQNIDEKTSIPHRVTSLNENKQLSRSIGNNEPNSDEVNANIQSETEIADEDFGFFGPFTSGNRSFRMRIHKIMAVTDPRVLAEFHARAKLAKKTNNSSKIVLPRRMHYGKMNESRFDVHEYDYESVAKVANNERLSNNVLRNDGNIRSSDFDFYTINDETAVVLHKQVNNAYEVNRKSLLLIVLLILLYLWISLKW